MVRGSGLNGRVAAFPGVLPLPLPPDSAGASSPLRKFAAPGRAVRSWRTAAKPRLAGSKRFRKRVSAGLSREGRGGAQAAAVAVLRPAGGCGRRPRFPFGPAGSVRAAPAWPTPFGASGTRENRAEGGASRVSCWARTGRSAGTKDDCGPGAVRSSSPKSFNMLNVFAALPMEHCRRRSPIRIRPATPFSQRKFRLPENLPGTARFPALSAWPADPRRSVRAGEVLLRRGPPDHRRRRREQSRGGHARIRRRVRGCDQRRAVPLRVGGLRSAQDALRHAAGAGVQAVRSGELTNEFQKYGVAFGFVSSKSSPRPGNGRMTACAS